jgi:regulator of nucleoside diphosphate kinase
METKEIYITEFDKERLEELLEGSSAVTDRKRRYLKQLEEELNRAIPIEPADVPRDVVTMNSRVRLKDLDSGKEMTYTLVFPHEGNIDEGKISILAPIGTAMIGHRVGDIIEWEVPAGLRRLRVEEILYQPEAEGHYHL